MSDKVVYSSAAPDVLGQIINPLTYLTSSSGMYGLVNIRYGVSSDAPTEQAIIENVAGYGKQIGRVLEAVECMARYLGAKDPALLTEKRISDLLELNTDIQAYRLSQAKPDSVTVSEFIKSLKALKQDNEARFNEVSAKLKEEIAKL